MRFSKKAALKLLVEPNDQDLPIGHWIIISLTKWKNSNFYLWLKGTLERTYDKETSKKYGSSMISFHLILALCTEMIWNSRLRKSWNSTIIKKGK